MIARRKLEVLKSRTKSGDKKARGGESKEFDKTRLKEAGVFKEEGAPPFFVF